MGQIVEVSASKTGENSRTVSCTWIPGDTLQEAIELYGEGTIFEHYNRSATVKFQGRIRALIEKGVPDEVIQRELNGWRPDETSTGPKDPVAAVLARYATMSDEEQAVLRETLGLGG